MYLKTRRFNAFLASALLLLTLTTGCKKKEVESDGNLIGYAEGVTIVDDPDALQRAVDDLYAQKDNGIALEYKNDAFSTDGINFDCYIANSLNNAFDMYIQIFADAELTDQLYLSQLVRPGQAFDHLKLDHALDEGKQTVYVVFTQVEMKDGKQAIHNQFVYTMDFSVS